MGGFNGFTVWSYNATPDRILVELLSVEFDDDGSYVRRSSRQGREGPTGRIKDAVRELPRPEVLALTPGDIASAQEMRPGAAVYYILAWWQVWKRRQAEGGTDRDGNPLTDERLREMWHEHLLSEN